MKITPSNIYIPMNQTLNRGCNIKIHTATKHVPIVMQISYQPKTHSIIIRHDGQNISINTIEGFHRSIQSLYPKSTYHLEINYRYSHLIVDGYTLSINNIETSTPLIFQYTQNTATHLRPAPLIIPTHINTTTSFADIFAIMQPQLAQHYAWIDKETNEDENISIYSPKIWGMAPIMQNNIDIHIETSMGDNYDPIHMKTILFTADESFVLADQTYTLNTNMHQNICDILDKSAQGASQYVQQNRAYFSQHTLIEHARIITRLPQNYDQNIHPFTEKLYRLFRQHYIHP